MKTIVFALLASVLSLGAQPGVGCNTPASTAQVGLGTGGFFGVLALDPVGAPLSDGTGGFAFQVSGGAPFGPGLLLLSRNEQPSFSSTYQATLYAGPTPVFVSFQFDAQGRATVAPGATSAPIAELCGRPLIAQATQFDFSATGGASWSNGLRFTFGAAAPLK